MDITQIEENLRNCLSKLNKSKFIFEFLMAYGIPKASIARLQGGDYNLSTKKNEIIWKGKIVFRSVEEGSLAKELSDIKNSGIVRKHDIRFIIVTDYKTLLAIDSESTESLDVQFQSLVESFDFFLPLAGYEKPRALSENPADVKAAEKMARLYDELKKDNPARNKKDEHNLNVFLSRLLFCLFAEDTEIFEIGMFTNSITFFTKEDGSDVNTFIDRLAVVLNKVDRDDASGYLKIFPYVNGGLFADKVPSPKFTAKSRRLLLECGDLNWSEINPDIFGSMIQAVVDTDKRADMGMHYTSVPNILRVIDSLFMDKLRKDVADAKGNLLKLERLLNRLNKICIFDPACGSGNFLIIAYKELRKLEIEILTQIKNLRGEIEVSRSCLELTQFFGIEIDDFAHEIAVLSLWLVEHQMNLAFKTSFNIEIQSLPLRHGGGIVQGNAAVLDWKKVCPINGDRHIYVIGNPPYLGSKLQEDTHKKDLAIALGPIKGAGVLDYISCWIYKASVYIRKAKAEVAFVSTNSICQGEQVSILWPEVLKDGLEISFAHQSFKWTNNAKKKAGVSCVIIGLRNRSESPKYLFKNGFPKEAENINAYLVDAADVYVEGISKAINGLPKMGIGNKPIDDGNFLFLENEKNEFLKKEPKAKNLFFRWFGSEEFLNGQVRWCLLTQDLSEKQLANLPAVKERVAAVAAFRKKSKSAPTRKIAKTPTRFHVECFPESDYIIVPKVSSERRVYVPAGFFHEDQISSDLLNVVESSEPYIFGLLSSQMHMVWVRAVAGRLETRIRYSSKICYNTFPVPKMTNEQKKNISSAVRLVLKEREKHSELPVGDLYDPDLMPTALLKAHADLDLVVDQIYQTIPFESDEERLELLFKLYDHMKIREKGKNSA